MAQRTILNTLIHEKKNKISGGLYHKIQVDLAYNSNHIEGSRLTHDQTRYIFETHTIEGSAHVNDILEAANHFKCFDFILDTVNEPLTEGYVKELHRMLKNGLIEDDSDYAVIGDYKKYPNEVGMMRTAHPKEVPALMEKLLNDISLKNKLDLYDIAEIYARFEKIHPFYDGNGRVGRLIMMKLCLANDVVPFIISDDIKMFYYMGLKDWQTMDKKERLLDVFLSMQDDMKVVLDYFEVEYDRTETTSRELIERHEGRIE